MVPQFPKVAAPLFSKTRLHNGNPSLTPGISLWLGPSDLLLDPLTKAPMPNLRRFAPVLELSAPANNPLAELFHTPTGIHHP